MRTLSFIILSILGSLSLAAQNDDLEQLLARHNNGDIAYVSVEELKMYQKDTELIVLDAREPEEFEVSHIPDGEFIGYNDFSLENFSQKFKDKSAAIVVYCSIGIRSENIAKKIRKAGYLNVTNLYGGIFEWKNANFPVINAEGNETEKVHAFSKTWGKWLKNAEKVY